MTFAERATYLIVAAALIGAAVAVTDWYWRGRIKHAVAAAETEGFNAGWAAHAEQVEARRRAVHAIGRTSTAPTVVLPRQKTGATR